MLLTMDNISNFVSENSEVMNLQSVLETLGFRGAGNQVAFGILSKRVIFGAQFLKMMGVNPSKAKSLNPQFKFVECEYIEEPLDFSQFQPVGRMESSFTVYDISKLGDVFVLRAQNGCKAIVTM
ncbi:hypothetical protein SHAb15599_00040 [Acinetobacter phage SH-Ab 15599]|nr:hypothetical protein SHAb15599_00040 [Acinetobacter phage SH-Ab 15599]